MGNVTGPSRRHLIGQLSTTFVVPAAFVTGLAPAARADDDSNAPPPLSVYGTLPSIAHAAISPDGRRIAVIRNTDDGLMLDDIELATNDIHTIAVEANSVPRLMWADNDSVFLITSQTSRVASARYEAWIGTLLNVPTGKRHQLYSSMSEYGANLVGDFHRIKKKGVYCATASNITVTAANYTIDYSTALFAFAATNFHPYLLDEDTRRVVNWAILGDGTPLARAEYDEDRQVWKLRYKGEHGWHVVFSTEASLDLPVLKGVGRDGKSVLLLMKTGDLKDNYVEIGADGVFGAPLCRYESRRFPLFNPVTGWLSGFTHEDGLDQAIFYDSALTTLPDRVRQITPDPLIDITDVAENPRQLILYSEGADNPGTYDVVDFSTGVRTRIGSTYPALPAAWIFAKHEIRYPASDGLMIPALLTFPKSVDPKGVAQNHATVVLPHGGPESFDDMRFDWLAQALASRGYLVLQANYRGSSGYGVEFTEKGYGEFGRKMQTDLSDGVRYLASQGQIDPGRVAIAGASYGGYAALAGAALEPGVYRCAAAISGFGNLDAYMDDILSAAKFNSKSRTVQYWRRYLGDPAGWDDISPIRHVAAVTAPILLVHGKDDTVVPVEQSYRMRDALRGAGKSVDLVLLDDDDHYLSRTPTRVLSLEALIAFLQKNNPVS